MSFESKAQVALVASIAEYRSTLAKKDQITKLLSPLKMKTAKGLTTSDSKKGFNSTNNIPGSQSMLSDDELAVKALDIPEFDKTRTFPGLSKLKVARKDRHMKALDEFSKLLASIAENIEVDVLNTSREMREQIEEIDENFQLSYKDLKNESFLIIRNELDLFNVLENLKIKISHRSNVIEKFAVDLDELEIKRATIVGAELKKLVDLLVSIAHQLPDEIEHIVESETFDLNTVLTTNRRAHAQVLGLLRGRQAEVEVECLQRWEDSRAGWRVLRHDKCIQDFVVDITSDVFRNPKDRHEYLLDFQANQQMRHSSRMKLINKLRELSFENITCDAVAYIQQSLGALTDDEMHATQTCYNHLNELRFHANTQAEARVECLRTELHTYGALKTEPDLPALGTFLEHSLNDEKLVELFRLGGGLKSEFQALRTDCTSTDVAYGTHVQGIAKRLEFLSSGFPVKVMLTERGRGAFFDKVRNQICKMRGVARGEVPGVLEALVPDLEEFLGMEALPGVFRSGVKDCVEEMVLELQRFRRASMSVTSNDSVGSGTRGSAGKASGKGKTGTVSGTVTGAGSGGAGKTKKTESTVSSTVGIDPVSVKAWHRRLGVLFFSGDLPAHVQYGTHQTIQAMVDQAECNRLVDQVVHSTASKLLARNDTVYKRLIEQIANFLEHQAGAFSCGCSNLGDFHMKLAKAVELHRKVQYALDEKTEDEVWDLSEDFRFEREDREGEYLALCQVLRESVGYEELHENFHAVLGKLDEIQGAYRVYHTNACFTADKYPLRLAEEYSTFLRTVAEYFFMRPNEEHKILKEFGFIYDETIRLNKKFFDVDPAAAGVKPRFEGVHESTHEGVQAHENPGESLKFGLYKSSNVTSSSSDMDEISDASSLHESKGGVKGGMKVEEGDDDDDDRNSAAPVEAYCGIFNLTVDFNAFIRKFFEDSSFAPHENTYSRPSTTATAQEETDTSLTSAAVAAAVVPSASASPRIDLAVELHPDFPWLRKEMAGEEAVHMKEEDFQALDEGDREEYEELISRMFVEISEELITTLTPESLELYNRMKVIADNQRSQQALEANVDFQRTNIPKDFNKQPVVLFLEISKSDVEIVITGIRDNIFQAIEIEAYKRLKRAESVALERKANFTDELEDKLRTHWPRRGRVETQIKQPRETELLGHEQKTWRHVQSIQQKMKDLQFKFFDGIKSAKVDCDKFIGEMTALRNSLSNEHFRNLAALQGVDVKARTISLAFQGSCGGILSNLNNIAVVDTSTVISFAKDFRKVCPLQAPGIEGGYSEAELKEIEDLVDGQCNEINSITSDWGNQIEQLKEQQEQSFKSHSEFVQKYEKCAQELALSEGLGQKYGAPRRRAQEKIRTEVTRDEQNAGKVDELLAELEFICSESQRKTEETNDDINKNADSSRVVEGANEDGDAGNNGREDLDFVMKTWKLLSQLRLAFNYRAKYLCIIDKNLPCPSLPWVSNDRIPSVKQGTDDLELSYENENKLLLEACPILPPSTNLQDIYSEVDKACRQETKALYESEGKAEILGVQGVPDSLSHWLEESKEKILGRMGYRERAWKRFWTQVYRFEIISSRKGPLNADDIREDEDEENEDREGSTGVVGMKLGISGVCLRYLVHAYISCIDLERKVREDQFLKVIKPFEQGRERHERLLRPRLGSPDAADELNDLNAREKKRSAEFMQNLLQCRSRLIKNISDQALNVFKDIFLCSQGLMGLIDSCIHQEVLLLPPDTAIPKKRMTLKRMRKAQRLREEIAKGKEDRSHQRVWPGLSLEGITELLKSSEDMVPDLDQLLLADAPAAPVQPPPVDKAATGKAAAVAKGKKNEPVAPPPVVEKPSLVSTAWRDQLLAESALKGEVSTAHRVLMSERDLAANKFVKNLKRMLDETRARFQQLILQESGWSERWDRQVHMLRKGNI